MYAIGIRRHKMLQRTLSANAQVFGRRQSRALPRADATGVRKAPRHEIAARGSATAMPQALWGFGHGRELEAGRFAKGYPGRTETQLKRYGTNIAKWGIHVLSHP